MSRAERTIPVWEVLADIAGDGPACDGTAVRRFRTEQDAVDFAVRAACYGRSHPPITRFDAPLRLARRWGMA